MSTTNRERLEDIARMQRNRGQGQPPGVQNPAQAPQPGFNPGAGVPHPQAPQAPQGFNPGAGVPHPQAPQAPQGFNPGAGAPQAPQAPQGFNPGAGVPQAPQGFNPGAGASQAPVQAEPMQQRPASGRKPVSVGDVIRNTSSTGEPYEIKVVETGSSSTPGGVTTRVTQGGQGGVRVVSGNSTVHQGSQVIDRGRASIQNVSAPAQPEAQVMPAPMVQDAGQITVVLSSYVRGTIARQYEMLRRIGFQDSQIRVVVNNTRQHSKEDLRFMANLATVNCTFDMGPWFRWHVAGCVDTPFVWVLDDDCFPGDGWVAKAWEQVQGGDIVCAAGWKRGPGGNYDSREPVGLETLHRDTVAVEYGRGSWLMMTGVLRDALATPRVGSLLSSQMHISAATDSKTVVLPYVHSAQGDWGMTGGENSYSYTSLLDGASVLPVPSDQLRRSDYEVFFPDVPEPVEALPPEPEKAEPSTPPQTESEPASGNTGT